MKATNTVLNGNQVYLRLMRSSDKELYYSAGLGQIDEEAGYYTGSIGAVTKEATDAFIDRIVADESRYDFLIFSQDDELLGEAIINHIDSDSRIASFRICIFRSRYFDQGIGTEAIRLILDFAFRQLGMHRIELEVYDYNLRARHVYERLGFIQEGAKREAFFMDGKYHDIIIMGMLESDYQHRFAGEA